MSAPRDVPLIVKPPANICGPGPSVVSVKLDPAQQQFTAVSGQPLELLGYRADVWLSPGFWAERLHPEDRDRVIEHCLAEAQAGRGHEIEYRMTDHLGEDVWVSQVCSIDQTRTEEMDLQLTGHIVDISEHLAHRADRARVAALRVALLELIDTDLYQPVNAVSSYARLLERHLASQDDDVGSDYAVSMRDGIQTLSRAITRIRAAIQDESVSLEAVLAGLSSETEEVEPVRQLPGRADAS